MDTNDGNFFDPPRLEVPAPAGVPSLPPPSMPQPPQFRAYDGEPTATVVPTGTVAKRSKGKVVGGLVAVVALLGAGGFAITKIVAGRNGGASSPTEVGTDLIAALGNEDALGVVDLLLPGEREMMRQPLIDIVDNLKRLEVVDGSATLDKVGGIDLSFRDVHVEPTDTNVADVADIRVTATGNATVDGAKVPIGNLLLDEAFGGDRPQIGVDAQGADADVDWKLATVKRDGRWYLSAFYSIAENSRKSGDDIPATPVVAHGAKTPEGAVQSMVDAVGDLDLEGVIAALNPNEAEALQRYAPLFIADAQKGLDDQDVKLVFTGTKFSVSGSGDRRTVAIDAFKLDAVVNGDKVTVESKDGCMVITSPDATTDSCQGGSSADTALTALGLNDNADVKALIKTVRAAFADMKPTGITVQRVNGAWFISPVGTVADGLLALVGALDKGELTDIIDGVKKATQSFSTDGILPAGGSGDSGSGTASGDGSDGGNADDGGGDTSGIDACFANAEFAAFSACLASGIEDGSIDATHLTPYYRFPECGVGEVYFSGDVYHMSDEEFTAFATGAAPCFQKLVAAGSISSFELPYELSRPDCLEGKNWYNVTDGDYGRRILACAS